MNANPQKLEAFVGKMLGDFGAAQMLALIRLGDELGLYAALAHAGPVTSMELAAASGTTERYVREWLSAHAAAGYLVYHTDSGRFEMTPEQAMVFAEPDSPVNLLGAYEATSGLLAATPRVAEAFRTGQGVGWHEHDQCVFRGTARFFRAGYQANLMQHWLPALDGVVAKLERGAMVADIGCGHGVSTRLMASAFPKSTFIGFDYHAESIAQARREAEGDSRHDNVRFEVAGAKDYPGKNYDLITCFDALHDMGDPVGATAHAYRALATDGTCMIVEPFAGDRLEDNLNPVGRIFYAASTMACTPGSLAQEVGLGLGAQAGEKRLSEVLREGGFTRVRRAAETPFNLVLEARH